MAILLLTAVNARPSLLGSSGQLEPEFPDADPLSSLDLAAGHPQLYLIIAEAVNENEEDNEEASSLVDQNVVAAGDDNVEKRSAEQADDLETAAGTNVLRPLFVYRQQLAFREHSRKGALKRFGIRPRF